MLAIFKAVPPCSSASRRGRRWWSRPLSRKSKARRCQDDCWCGAAVPASKSLCGLPPVVVNSKTAGPGPCGRGFEVTLRGHGRLGLPCGRVVGLGEIARRSDAGDAQGSAAGVLQVRWLGRACGSHGLGGKGQLDGIRLTTGRRRYRSARVYAAIRRIVRDRDRAVPYRRRWE